MIHPIRFRRYAAAAITLLALSGCVWGGADPTEVMPVPTTHHTAPTDGVPTSAPAETAPHSSTEGTIPHSTPGNTLPEGPTESITSPTAHTASPTVPATTPPTIPETAPATVPETILPTVPETTPTTVPETVLTTVPETVPTAVPETTSASVPTEAETHLYTVTFLDHDGSILAVRDVAPGRSALLPPDPFRSGHLFAGWSGRYQNVTGDTAVTATYVSLDAPNLFALESTVAGDTVSVVIRLRGSILACGLECRLDYDEAVLQYVGMTKHNNVEANHIAPNSNSQVILVWAGSDNMTTGTIRDGGILLELRFRVTDTAATDTVLTFLEDEMYVDVVDENGNYSAGEFTLTKGVVHLK